MVTMFSDVIIIIFIFYTRLIHEARNNTTYTKITMVLTIYDLKYILE